jgi:hypothetical protein
MPDSPHMMPIQPDGLESLHRSVGAVLDAEDVPPLGPNIGISQIKGTQSWHSLAAEHTVDLVLQGLGDRGLFESAGLEALETLTSLARAKAHPGIKRLLAAFEESGLAPQLGHNPSSQRISLTMPLPVGAQQTPAHHRPAQPANICCPYTEPLCRLPHPRFLPPFPTPHSPCVRERLHL